jgi:hypothetical protein
VRFKLQQSGDVDVLRGSYNCHWSLKIPWINDPGTLRHGWIPWLARWRRSITRTNSTDVEKEYQTDVIKVEATSKNFFCTFLLPGKFLPGMFHVGCGSFQFQLLLSNWFHGNCVSIRKRKATSWRWSSFCLRCQNSRNSKLLTLPLAIRWLAVVVMH